jgi:hypothetical protein
VCACVRVCARARARVCVCVCVCVDTCMGGREGAIEVGEKDPNGEGMIHGECLRDIVQLTCGDEDRTQKGRVMNPTGNGAQESSHNH